MDNPRRQTKRLSQKVSHYGAVVTVAIAFFIAKFGDKTQLATISLAAEYQNPVRVLMGTTIGMLIAGGVGIVIRVMLCKRIPQRKIKCFSAIIFVLFGLVGLYEVLSVKLGLGYITLILTVLTALSAYAMKIISKKNQYKIPKLWKKPNWPLEVYWGKIIR
jgi:uncharacterized membrane protein